MRDGLVTFAVASNLAQNAHAMELSSQVLFFAVHAVLCYCAGAKLLCALELLRQAYLLLRFVLRFCVFFATRSLQIALDWLHQGILVLRPRAFYAFILNLASQIVLKWLHQGCHDFVVLIIFPLRH